jgi:hypothetical protein
MPPTARHRLGFLSACITLLPLLTHGQGTNSHAPPNTAHTKRIEGTVARIDGNELLLKVRGGTTETYQLSPDVRIARSRSAQMSDLTAGIFVGCINLYGQSEKKVAGECSILPDGLHALVENRDDAAAAQSGWVSGTITDVRDDAAVQAKGNGIWIQISDNGHAMTMAVTRVTRITILSAADASVLKPGMKVRGVSQQAVDGTEVVQTLTAVATPSRNRKVD